MQEWVAQSMLCDFELYYIPRLVDGEVNVAPEEFWPWVYRVDSKKYTNMFLIVELALCIPFSTAVVERGFSAIRRILTDWRSTLSHPLITDCMHFSTRKKQLQNKSYRHDLVNEAVDTFIEGTE